MRKYSTLLLVLLSAILNGQAQDLANFKDEKWATFHGSLGGAAYIYSVNGIPPRRVPFSYILTGQATVTLKGVELPFSFQYSEQNRDFRQPFNQFGISPRYKWAQLHLGWRNMSFSNYTMNGYTFLGAGLELTPGRLRFGAMYGRLLKAVQEDSNKQVYNSASQYPYAAYNRMGYAVKLGVGSPRNYFDLIYFKGKDDKNSLTMPPQVQQIQPGENVSIGTKMKFTFFKKLTLEADAAVSAYTRNVNADSLAIDDKTGTKIADLTMQPRLSTAAYYAGDAALQYREQQWGIGLKYQRITPDYKSMGIYFIQTDLERYTLSPEYHNKTNTIQVNASGGLEHDNLLKKKLAQSNRAIGSLNLNINPKPEYGISLQYANFGVSQRPGLRSLNDTVVVDQVTQSIVAAPHYMLQRSKAIHTFTYVFANQSLNDRNKFNSINFDMTSINNTLSYVVFLNDLDISFDLSGFYTNTKIQVGNSNSTGASAGVSKTFLKNKLSSTLNGTYSSNTFNGTSDGSTIQVRTVHQYRVTKHHNFRLDINYTKNNSASGAINKSFNELLTTIGYNYTF